MHIQGRSISGFYPTPPRVLDAISSLITNSTQHPGRLLDPCAGNGIPLHSLAHAWNLSPYGIELDRQRAAQCRTGTANILHADAKFCEVSREAFSSLFLNPPYDSAGHGVRTEEVWLKRWTPMLQPEGLLIYIIQEHQFSETILYYLSHYYRDVSLFRFPPKEYRDFSQTVFIGKRVRTPNHSETVKRQLWKLLRSNSLPELPTHATPLYTIPPLFIRGEITFRTTWIDPTDIYTEAHHHGLWNDPHITDLLSFHKHKTISPLLPLRKGHLTRLITAGLYNNTVIEHDNRRWIIKGRARKLTTELPPITEMIETKEGPEVRINLRTIEKYVPEIRAFDLTPGTNYGQFIVVEC
jgi:16S rRNA G966 N2-methylase RsmD